MTVYVNAIMYYKVANAIHAVANVDDYGGSARLLAATTLRNVLGTLTLGDILCNREAIAKEMKVRAMAAEAEAAREARAKVIAAEGEHKASRALRHAAEVIADSPAALQVMNGSQYLFYKLLVSVEIPADFEQYFGGEQQYNHLPCSN